MPAKPPESMHWNTAAFVPLCCEFAIFEGLHTQELLGLGCRHAVYSRDQRIALHEPV